MKAENPNFKEKKGKFTTFQPEKKNVLRLYLESINCYREIERVVIIEEFEYKLFKCL